MIGISVLDSDFGDLEGELQRLRESGVTHVHIDIMDTSFVDNISFGPAIANRILKHGFVFDIHMMVADPMKILVQLDLQRVSLVTVHHSMDRGRVFEHLRSRGVQTGVAVSPGTAVEDVDLEDADFVLVMTVEPGFGGQKLIGECLQKIQRVKESGRRAGVDGGVNMDNIGLLGDADYVVVGSAYFKAGERRLFLEAMNERWRKPRDGC